MIHDIALVPEETIYKYLLLIYVNMLHHIHYESQKALKAHVFADFIAEMTFPAEESTEEWTVFADGSSNSKGSGAWVIIENNQGIVVEISLGLSFL